MATHSSILAWRIPGTEEPGGLPSLGSHRVKEKKKKKRYIKNTTGVQLLYCIAYEKEKIPPNWELVITV